MARYRILIEYDGKNYAGWQFQAGQRTVQGAIEEAIKGFSGEEVRISGAGRTDAGVHAFGQVAHFDLARDWPAHTVANALNALLALADDRIAILDAARAADDFHSRFSATGRSYLYRILNRRAPGALEHDRAWSVTRHLDIDAMNLAAQELVGTHDFTTFRSAHCQSKSPVKTLDRLEVSRKGELVEIRTSARSFLHNQVRSIAGTLKLVGVGKWSPADVASALEVRDRKACGPVAPAAGLFLLGVEYPAAHMIWPSSSVTSTEAAPMPR